MVELLVTMSILVMLIALMMPAVGKVRTRARKFDCQMNLRSLSFDFRMFADPVLHGQRGDDARDPRLNPDREFWLETFQESEYKIDEFWGWTGGTSKMPAKALGVMNCAEIRGDITLRQDQSCRGGAVQPRQNVSYAFNLRLDRPERRVGGRLVPVPTPVSEQILDAAGRIPLAWDIDGAEAASRDITPHFSVAPADPDGPFAGGPYSDDRLWFPGARHGGQVQVVFTDGSVVCSADPLNESGWLWEYTRYNR